MQFEEGFSLLKNILENLDFPIDKIRFLRYNIRALSKWPCGAVG